MTRNDQLLVPKPHEGRPDAGVRNLVAALMDHVDKLEAGHAGLFLDRLQDVVRRAAHGDTCPAHPVSGWREIRARSDGVWEGRRVRKIGRGLVDSRNGISPSGCISVAANTLRRFR